MKPRQEYEKICDKTFALAGEAQSARIQIDLLLDIRDLLMWMRDREMLKDIITQREKVTSTRTIMQKPLE